MIHGVLMVVVVVACVIIPCAAFAWEPDVSKFPVDKAVLPSLLENMRPGQVRDAVARNTPVILPIATIESIGEDTPLGVDRAQGEAALLALAKAKNAIIAPTIWYGPNGFMLSGPADGTIDMPIDVFAAYIKEVLLTLTTVGFKSVLIVPLHNPQGGSNQETPMISACYFAIGDIFNDYWKDPQFGEGWWDKPGGIETLPWHPYQVVDLPAVTTPAAGHTAQQLPLRLENMTTAEVKKAISSGLPLFLPIGVLECHGNQNPIGVDAIEAQDPVVLAAAQAPAVVAPAIWFGPTATAVSGPKLGSLDINGVVFQRYIDSVISGLAELGFKTLTVTQCHQGGGAQRTGIMMAIQQYRARLSAKPGFGPGWAKRKDLNYCDVAFVAPPNMPGDHAGKNETSWMLGLRPDFTDMSMLT